jgi:hypothetical protein
VNVSLIDEAFNTGERSENHSLVIRRSLLWSISPKDEQGIDSLKLYEVSVSHSGKNMDYFVADQQEKNCLFKKIF